MEMNVGHRTWLPGELRCVEVVDVVVPAVEQVEDVQLQLHLLTESRPGARVDERSRLRSHAVVLDKRPRTEATPAQRAEPAVSALVRHAGRRHLIGGAAYVVARRIFL